MKTLALVVLALAFVAISATAAPVHLKLRPIAVIPDTATAHYAHYSPRLTAKGKLRAAQLAIRLAGGSLNPSQIEGIVQLECTSVLSGCNGIADIEALAFLVMMQAAKSAQDDLKTLMQGVKAIDQSKAETRGMQAKLNALSVGDAQQLNAGAASIKDKLDTMSDLGQEDQLRLQMAMDRYSKLMQMLSNIEKKMSDTDKSIVNNMK